MIRIVDVHKSFGPKRVLRGVNLTIRKGETMVVIGQSGSGKSVLIKHLIGLLRPDSGKIYIDGIEITRLHEDEMTQVTRKFGLLFQGAALFDSMTVAENIRFGLQRYARLSEEEMRARV